jgi:hypothetical protein
MRKTFTFALLMTATAAFAGRDHDQCRHEEPRRLTSPLAGVTKVVIHGDAGSLHVDGRQGVTEFLAAGTACTSDEDLLKDINLTARRSGSELHIEAHVPDHETSFSFWYEARLDFGVVVPAGIAIEVHDGSGWTKVTNVGTTEIEDGSGSLEIANIRGDLTVRDGSGSIDIDGVTGNVDLEDGSGEIEIRNVDGSVEIEDDSGAISAERVKRNVTISDDGSGGVDVRDVGGDFTVRSKGSGGLHYARITGRVSVANRDRD